MVPPSKNNYWVFFVVVEFINLKGHSNYIIGSKISKILLRWCIVSNGGVALARVWICSLLSIFFVFYFFYCAPYFVLAWERI